MEPCFWRSRACPSGTPSAWTPAPATLRTPWPGGIHHRGNGGFPSVYLRGAGFSSLGTGAVSAFVLLPQAAFSLDYYTDAYLQAEGAEELLCYSEDYTELVNSLSDALEPLAEERSACGGVHPEEPSRPWRTPAGAV